MSTMNSQVVFLVIVAITLQLCPTRSLNVEPRELAYQVFYDIFVPGEGWVPQCGGTIIASNLIITAASCLETDYTHLKIYFGATNIKNESEVGQERLKVSKSNVIIHEEYQGAPVYLNNIALIRLPVDVIFDEYVQPATINVREQDYTNLTALSSGWGLTKTNPTTGDKERTNTLEKFDARVISNSVCKDQVLRANPGMFFSSSFLCANLAKNTQPCRQDVGGPLVVKDENTNRSRIIGIVSKSVDDLCKINTPAIYTRISSYIAWIYNNANIPMEFIEDDYEDYSDPATNEL